MWIAIAVVAAALFAAGVARARRLAPALAGSGQSFEDCRSACANWVRLRNQRRSFDAAVAIAKAALDTALAVFNRVAAQIAVLLAAAAIAQTIPFLGPAIAAGIFAAASPLMAYSTFLLGEITALQLNYGVALTAQKDAQDLETLGLTLLREKCPAEQVSSCMNAP